MIPGMSKEVSPHVVVVGNEKGGSGKSTVALHIAVGLMKAGWKVSTVDLDARQRTLTRYIENRSKWAKGIGRPLVTPRHICFADESEARSTERRASCREALIDAVTTVAKGSKFVVIDTPGYDTFVGRLIHSMADTLITPLNDSFVDLDVLAGIDPATFTISSTSHYARMVEDARYQRQLLHGVPFDWVVLRNRISTIGLSRNKRLVGTALEDLSRRLNFRFVDGLAERVIFREFFPRGLTAVDDIAELASGMRPTMSHATARLEVQSLLNSVLQHGLSQFVVKTSTSNSRGSAPNSSSGSPGFP